jgi:transmembrane protein EpsG
MDLALYSATLIVVVIIAYLSEYSIIKFDKISNENDESFLKKKIKIPLFLILFLSVILSIYSATLAISGKLVDTVRYAWNFIYRYPAYYGSVDGILNAGTEPGFLLLNYLIGIFTENSFLLFFILALITTFINLYFLARVSKNFALLLFLYLISLFFFQSIFLLKQTLAVAFVNLAFLSYIKGFRLRYIMYSIVAFSFHATAIILFPFLLILKNWKSGKVYFYIILISFITMFLFGPIFNSLLPNIPFIGNYLNADNLELSSGGGSFTAIFKGIPYYLLTMLALIKRNSLKKVMFKADFYILCAVLYSVSWLFTYNMYWFSRMGWYFMLPTLVLVPNLFSTIKNPKERVLIYIIFIFILMTITYRQISITL